MIPTTATNDEEIGEQKQKRDWLKSKWREPIENVLMTGPRYTKEVVDALALAGPDARVPYDGVEKVLRGLVGIGYLKQNHKKYYLPGYERTPDKGDQVVIKSEYLDDWLRLGWKVKNRINKERVVVEYRFPHIKFNVSTSSMSNVSEEVK